MLTLRLTADACPDANGYITLRESDGTEHGRIDVQPVATVYDEVQARLIVERVNAAEYLAKAMRLALAALACEGEFEHLSRRSSGEQIDAAHEILTDALKVAA